MNKKELSEQEKKAVEAIFKTVKTSFTNTFFFEHVGNVLILKDRNNEYEVFNTRLMVKELESKGLICHFDPEKQSSTARKNPYYVLTIQR